jgi:hypothetical protein
MRLPTPDVQTRCVGPKSASAVEAKARWLAAAFLYPLALLPQLADTDARRSPCKQAHAQKKEMPMGPTRPDF